MRMLKNAFVSKRCRILTLVLCLNSLLSGVGSSLGDDSTGVTKEWVKIGLMGDFTGPAAEGWIQIADGAKSFFEMANSAGGIHGRKVKYIFEDDRYSIPLALSAFKKLVYKDKIFILQAASGVGHTAAVIPLAEKEKMPLIAATGEKKFFVPARKYIFSPIPWYEDQAKLSFEYIFNEMKLKIPTIALMHPDTASGKDTREAVRKLVKVYPTKKYKEVAFSLTALAEDICTHTTF
ncbi:MAG: ABC transporter substrate-binding protein [Thermodesulfobacteriota bacterium]|nr:ABC transporter substrate-binding protein [Thermodesulfobacteriota bacterium]